MPVSKHRTELYVGLFLILGVVLLGWLIVRFGQFRGNPGGGYPITVEVNDATGVRAGVPVRLGGVDIGKVAADPILAKDYTSLVIQLKIFPDHKIPTGSIVKVGTSGLMGDSFVRIIPPEKPSGEFFPEGHHILAESTSSLNDLAGSAGETLEEMSITAAEIRAAADRVDSLFTRMEKGFLTDENVANVGVMLAELRASSENINSAAKKLNPLIDESRATISGVAATAEAAKATLGRVDEGVATLTGTLAAVPPVLIDFDRTLEDLRTTLNAINKLVNTLENGEGLAPSLLKDSELKHDLESFLDKLDRNGLLLYPREGGILRDGGRTGNSPPAPGNSADERRPFPGLRKQP